MGFSAIAMIASVSLDEIPPFVLHEKMPVRDALPSDAQALADVHVASWKAAYRGMLPDAFLDSLTPASRLEGWKDRLSEPQNHLQVWEEEGRVSGFCFAGASRDNDVEPLHCGEIYAIYLLPEAWGKGEGAALCVTALEALRRKGFREVTLWVLRQNTRARTFYERMGFAVDGASRIETIAGGVVLDEVRYRRSLL